MTWTEAGINGFAESELTRRFDTLEYQLLIVAEKYQTGFEQPKLCAMYVDKRLAGLQAVQTLSRLNRSYPGKRQTFILDFQNTVEEIKDAFRPFFEVTELEAVSDPNQIYELEGRIKTFGIIDDAEVERFAATRLRGPLSTQDRIRLEGLVRLLPNREIPPDVGITEDMLRLQAFRVQKEEEAYASLHPGEGVPLQPIREFAAKPYTEDEERSLSEIIAAFNERHGTQFTHEDFLRFEQVTAEVLTEDMVEMLRNNPADVVFSAFSQAFFKGSIRMFQRDKEMRSIVLSDAQARDQATRHFFNRAMRMVRETATG